MKTVFIDGSAGTTGLRIAERMKERSDLHLLQIPQEDRKNIEARKAFMNRADVVFLCLPDDAARQAAALIENSTTAVIDCSTAHRVDPQWVYGFAELPGQREKIRSSKRIANPGCHASGVIALVRPLTENGLLSNDAALSCFSITGYTGGGKAMIIAYEDAELPKNLHAPRQYGLSQLHKHLPEMQKYAKLSVAPVFCPVVAPFAVGMEVTVQLHAKQTTAKINEIRELYQSVYHDGLIRFRPQADEDGFLCANALAGTDRMEVSVFGNDERILLTARFDNLGKGASGAAIQNMNLLLGVDECTGLII